VNRGAVYHAVAFYSSPY